MSYSTEYPPAAPDGCGGRCGGDRTGRAAPDGPPDAMTTETTDGSGRQGRGQLERLLRPVDLQRRRRTRRPHAGRTAASRHLVGLRHADARGG